MSGPTTADLGRDLATVNVGSDYVFIEAPDARRLLEAPGNPTDGGELGIIVPKDENAQWFVVFEYRETEWVTDDDGKSLNAPGALRIDPEPHRGLEHQTARPGPSAASPQGLGRGAALRRSDATTVWALSAEAEGEPGEVINGEFVRGQDEIAEYGLAARGRWMVLTRRGGRVARWLSNLLWGLRFRPVRAGDAPA